jgi:hypothetical protein
MITIAPSVRSTSVSTAAPVRTFNVDRTAVDKLSKHMQAEVLGNGEFASVGHGDIPAIDLVPAQGSNALTVLQNHNKNVDGMDYAGPAKYKVSALPGDKTLDFTLLCPVSGHCGEADAKAWAGLDPKRPNDTNVFNVRITLADGTQKTFDNLKATGYITELNLSIPLQSGKIKIEYWPENSGGVGGYPSGRTIEITV